MSGVDPDGLRAPGGRLPGRPARTPTRARPTRATSPRWPRRSACRAGGSRRRAGVRRGGRPAGAGGGRAAGRPCRWTGGSAGATGCPGACPPAGGGWPPRGRSAAGGRARWRSRTRCATCAPRRPPARGARRRSAGEVVSLSPAAVRRMCEVAAGPGPLGARTAALVEVLYGCGLRASEAAGLDLSACHLDDPDDPFLHGPRQGRQAARGGRAARSPGVAHGLPAHRPPGAARARPHARGPTRPTTATPTPSSSAPAGGASAARPCGASSPTWPTAPACATAGERVFPHALRHSCGTHLIQSGVDIRYVQAHLGHASPVTTEIYTHVTAAHLREDFDRAHPRARRASGRS